MTFYEGAPDRSYELAAPAQAGLLVGRVYRLKISNMPDFPGVEFFPSIELIDRLHLKPGELEMYVAYGGRDQFNMDAQIDSFLYVAKQRGLPITVDYDPRGKHDLATVVKFLPGIFDWLTLRLAPYSPKPEGVTP